jgi:transposase
VTTPRTAVINQIRGFLLESGIAVRQGPAGLREALPTILAQRTDVLSPRMIHLLEDLAADWRQLDERVAAITQDIAALARQDAGCQRLMGIPGIGVITASAMVAAVGTGAAFAKGRDFAAWLGLVPKQISTGDRTILGGLSKRGNRYLRTLLVGGAQALLRYPARWQSHGFGRWLQAAGIRLHRNVLAVALANKLARIAWGVLRHENSYDPEFIRRTV